MRRTINPDQILRNLRSLIDEAEIVFLKGNGKVAEEQLLELRERMQAGFNRLRELSGEMGHRLHHVQDDLGERFRDYYEEMEGRIRAGAGKTTETVRAHPYRTALIAGGIALLVGSLCSRSRRFR